MIRRTTVAVTVTEHLAFLDHEKAEAEGGTLESTTVPTRWKDRKLTTLNMRHKLQPESS